MYFELERTGTIKFEGQLCLYDIHISVETFSFQLIEVGHDTIAASNLIEKIESWEIKLIDNVLSIYLM